MTEPTPWHEVLAWAAAAPDALLDVRSGAEAAAGHLPGSAGLPVPAGADPADHLPVYLLPPRHAPLLVLAADPAEAERVAVWLRERGRPHVVAAAPDWSAAPAGALAPGPPDGRLWRPPDWLAEHADLLPAPGAGPVLDLGSGSGRAAAWLCTRGHRVTAVDRHDDALAWARRLAADASGELTTLQADLTDAAAWPPGPWAAALAFRFLHRPLVAALAGLVQPGGVAMIRTFRWERGPWSLPRRRYCLQPGELPGFFPAAAWEVLVHREDADADGKPAAGIVARRR